MTDGGDAFPRNLSESQSRRAASSFSSVARCRAPLKRASTRISSTLPNRSAGVAPYLAIEVALRLPPAPPLVRVIHEFLQLCDIAQILGPASDALQRDQVSNRGDSHACGIGRVRFQRARPSALYSPSFAFSSRSSDVSVAICASRRWTRMDSGSPCAAGSASVMTSSDTAPPRR
jgi:hypothetical protein